MSSNANVKTMLAEKFKVKSRRIWPSATIAVALLLTACGGDRPTFAEGETTLPVSVVAGDPATNTVSTPPVTVAPITPVESLPEESAGQEQSLALTDCLNVVGPGPWPVVIEPTPEPEKACGRVAAHHRITFTNNTPTAVNFNLAGQPIAIEPGAEFTTEPIGTLAEPGLILIEAVPYGITSPWLIGPEDDAMAGSQVLLGKFGPIQVGMSPADAEVAVGGNGLAKTNEAGCDLSYVMGDPYSPLFTVRDGSITAIQVFTPGQQTRSGIGVGSTEAEVQTAYGANIVTEAAASGDPTQKLMVFVPTDETDGANRIVFAVDNGVVTSLRTGLTESIISAPGC